MKFELEFFFIMYSYFFKPLFIRSNVLIVYIALFSLGVVS